MTYTGTSRLADFARGLGALTLFACLLVGFPIGMYKMMGSPIPDRMPSWEEVRITLMRPDDDGQFFIAVLTLIGWGAWLLFVLTSIIEAIRYLADCSTAILRGPIRPLQQLIRDLATMATLTFSTVASIANSASAAAQTHAATGVHAATDPEPNAPGRSTHGHETPAPEPTTSDWTPLLAAQTPPAQGSERPWRTHTIEHGDTLWDLAQRTYGSGVLYPKIFESSQRVDQPDGVPALTDPDDLYPGQRVRLPRLGEPGSTSSPSRTTSTDKAALSGPSQQQETSDAPAPAPPRSPSAKTTPSRVPTPVVAPPADHPVSPSPSTPSHQDDHRSPLAVTLPSGSRIGLGLAAALSAAVAATRLHRRRRRPINTDPTSYGSPAELPIPAPVLKARQAHMATYADHDAPLPSDGELAYEELLAEGPNSLVIGTCGDRPVSVPLPGLSLGLSGDGAHAAVRAIATELVPKARRYHAEIIIPQADAQVLFPGADIAGLSTALEGLIITPSLSSAIERLEAELLRRGRMLQADELPDVPALRVEDPGEPLPTMLLVAKVPEHGDAAVHALAALGRRYCIGALILGAWQAGTSLDLAADGTVTAAHGPDSDQFVQARLFHLTADDAAGMLQTIQTANGSEPDVSASPQAADTPSEPVPPSVTSLVPPPRRVAEGHRAPARLQVLGPVLLHTADGPIATGLRKGARHLLGYLALHPKGVTRDQAIGALWPDATPQSGVNRFNSATSSIRGVLRTATGLTEPRFLIHTAGRYRIDHDLVDVDLWQLTATLADAKRAVADEDADNRINALALVSDLYTGGFADDFEFAWAETYREHLRRTVVDALGHFVQLVKEDKPESALATLERAITLDLYTEPLYQEIMRLQARLGRSDAVQRTYRLLELRLDEIDAEPCEETSRLLADLRQPRPLSGRRPSKASE
ncbi:LysM peptidoglycan-binding domain-containing protein [Actinomadura sp. LD22]|uniref:LysM peptidoglycan-binding domain-containing protein n=1 Tax=Actinomadura physcomitrii TaxID=2650748 RepID=A0A6I4MFI6_9ACTN|nr:BTAD domain-containing putative transcriptional regulator [Actinomadura physcomitrii]MWA02747.1 LysM peptidoglycan-binding domain-containing protein [Actinomadura physcomitrii]